MNSKVILIMQTILAILAIPGNSHPMTNSSQSDLSDASTSTTSIEIINSYHETLWIAIVGSPSSVNGGFRLDAGQRHTIATPRVWASGRIWARTGCTGSGGNLVCETGDCGHMLSCTAAVCSISPPTCNTHHPREKFPTVSLNSHSSPRASNSTTSVWSMATTSQSPLRHLIAIRGAPCTSTSSRVAPPNALPLT